MLVLKKYGLAVYVDSTDSQNQHLKIHNAAKYISFIEFGTLITWISCVEGII